jgi:hypothetical protein
VEEAVTRKTKIVCALDPAVGGMVHYRNAGI